MYLKSTTTFKLSANLLNSIREKIPLIKNNAVKLMKYYNLIELCQYAVELSPSIAIAYIDSAHNCIVYISVQCTLTAA